MTDGSGRVGLPVPARALAIGAHPDDIEFGCGATLAKWAAHGAEVHLLVLTDGSKGTWDEDHDLGALVQARRAEQRAAATTLGASGVHFLDHVDGELESDLRARAEVCAVIRRTRPEVVLGHDPWKRYRLHPDHRHAGLLALEGVVAARDPHFFPEQGLQPHRPRWALLFEADEPDHVEGVEGYVDAKVAALLCHESQLRSTMGIHEDPERERAAFTASIERDAATAGAAAGARAGERFKRLTDL